MRGQLFFQTQRLGVSSDFNISESILVVVQTRDSFEWVENQENGADICVDLHISLLVSLLKVVE